MNEASEAGTSGSSPEAGIDRPPDRTNVLLHIIYTCENKADVRAQGAREARDYLRSTHNVLADAGRPTEERRVDYWVPATLWQYEDNAIEAGTTAAEARGAAEEAEATAGLCRLAYEEVERNGRTTEEQKLAATQARRNTETSAHSARRYADEAGEIEKSMPTFDRAGAEGRKRRKQEFENACEAMIAELRKDGRSKTGG